MEPIVLGGDRLKAVGYLILWAAFTLTGTVAACSLERMEGWKITTTEYYGLHNLGNAFVALMALTASFAYLVLVLPLSLLISRIVAAAWGRLIVYGILGGVGGRFVFRWLYNDGFRREYGLNVSTAILIFAVAGIVHALIENGLRRRGM